MPDDEDIDAELLATWSGEGVIFRAEHTAGNDYLQLSLQYPHGRVKRRSCRIFKVRDILEELLVTQSDDVRQRVADDLLNRFSDD